VFILESKTVRILAYLHRYLIETRRTHEYLELRRRHLQNTPHMRELILCRHHYNVVKYTARNLRHSILETTEKSMIYDTCLILVSESVLTMREIDQQVVRVDVQSLQIVEK
jgi:hypothetical protein